MLISLKATERANKLCASLKMEASSIVTLSVWKPKKLNEYELTSNSKSQELKKNCF